LRQDGSPKSVTGPTDQCGGGVRSNKAHLCRVADEQKILRPFHSQPDGDLYWWITHGIGAMPPFTVNAGDNTP
jgi:hypothetical protein